MALIRHKQLSEAKLCTNSKTLQHHLFSRPDIPIQVLWWKHPVTYPIWQETLPNPSCHRVKTKNSQSNAAQLSFVAHGEEQLQNVLDWYPNAWKVFRLTNRQIAWRKRKSCAKNPKLSSVFLHFTYLCSSTSDNASINVELGKRSGKATTNISKLSNQVCKTENSIPKLKLLFIVLESTVVCRAEEGITIWHEMPLTHPVNFVNGYIWSTCS